MAMIFDTLKLSKSLRAADFSETQPDALASALSEQVHETLATKADVLHLEMSIGEKLTELRAELKDEMSLMRSDTVRWIATAIAFNFVATGGLFITVFKLFVK